MSHVTGWHVTEKLKHSNWHKCKHKPLLVCIGFNSSLNAFSVLRRRGVVRCVHTLFLQPDTHVAFYSNQIKQKPASRAYIFALLNSFYKRFCILFPWKTYIPLCTMVHMVRTRCIYGFWHAQISHPFSSFAHPAAQNIIQNTGSHFTEMPKFE